MTTAEPIRAVDGQGRLVERCLARDSRAWAELILLLEPLVTRCLVRALGPRHAHAVEDLRMEILETLVAGNMLTLRVFRSRPLDELRAWMHRVARNHAMSHLRRQRRAHAAAAALPAMPPLLSPVLALDAAIDGRRAIERFDGEGRQMGTIARLRASGHSVPEISARAGVSAATVKRALRDWRLAAEA